ncbi:hypothetical protein PMAYCL1PPCAC_07706, partial [Pristionchus mayeri]
LLEVVTFPVDDEHLEYLKSVLPSLDWNQLETRSGFLDFAKNLQYEGCSDYRLKKLMGLAFNRAVRIPELIERLENTALSPESCLLLCMKRSERRQLRRSKRIAANSAAGATPTSWKLTKRGGGFRLFVEKGEGVV